MGKNTLWLIAVLRRCEMEEKFTKGSRQGSLLDRQTIITNFVSTLRHVSYIYHKPWHPASPGLWSLLSACHTCVSHSAWAVHGAQPSVDPFQINYPSLMTEAYEFSPLYPSQQQQIRVRDAILIKQHFLGLLYSEFILHQISVGIWDNNMWECQMVEDWVCLGLWGSSLSCGVYIGWR